MVFRPFAYGMQGEAFSRFNRVKIGIICVASMGFMVGCGESTVSQCNRLVAEVNKGQEISQNIKGADSAAMQQLSKDLNGLSQTIGGVALKDESLVGYRDRFVQIYQNLGGAAATVGKALDELQNLKGKDAVTKAKAIQQQAIEATQTSTQAIKDESTLIEEVNTYCGGDATPKQ